MDKAKGAVLITDMPEEAEPKGPLEYLELTFDDRSKPRKRFVTNQGTEIALALKRGTMLSDEATICNTSQLTVIVKAKPESVLAIYPKDKTQACLVAHHLGNWHRSMQVSADGSIFALPDTPLNNWLTQNQIKFEPLVRPYQPNVRGSAHD
jgi:urease accessory protein